MSEMNKTPGNQTWRGAPEEEAVRKLMEEAGPRPALPQEDLASIQEAAHAEWQRRYGGQAPQKPVRWWVSLAAAALIAAVGIVWWTQARQTQTAAAPTVASIELLTGAVDWEAKGEGDVALLPDAVGRPLPAGSQLKTGASPERLGRLALRMAGGASVRLDAGTKVRLASATLVELTQGAVYVDTGGKSSGGEDVAVRTPAGLFQSIGTQFEVRAELGGVATRLRVREGNVILNRAGESVRTDTGQELLVLSDGNLARRPIAAYGPEWDWVLQAAPMLNIEGVKVRTFLDWLARETGRRVEVTDGETDSLCDSTVLHGSIQHLTPAEAPSVVLPSSGLGHRVSDGALVVFVAKNRAP